MLHATEVPILLRRPHIHRGYRPLNQPKKYYYKSAFYAHNECLNVWTHFAPLFFLLYYYTYPELISDSPRFPVLLLHFGHIILFLGSSSAHLLHSRSPHDHIFWFCIDFAGIAIFGMCIGLQRYACQSDLNPFIDWMYLPSLFIVSLLGQFFSSCALFVHYPFWKGRAIARMATGLFVAIWLYLPIIHRYTDPIEGDDMSVHTRAFTWLIVSGIFMGGNFPERFFPGIFDVIGYGHQLFHLCVNMVGWNLLYTADTDCPAPSGDAWMEVLEWRNFYCLLTVIVSTLIIIQTLRILMKRAEEKKYD
ncbi:hypothetical protein PRIPAC_72166 [Pristionchus pacificus]|uniref:Uncharacterized protein n=1 Tax=Pristionchus pacificus TaxID=54126 RepID=A0A2A6C9R6_PRIPA|nr:hypothetical protein PRIPAC_72166 [Pristionchus pacificus]|eukprot:PDM74818.1 hypothetical protein PRIPAC_43231 [Pristionchus pacificus]